MSIQKKCHYCGKLKNRANFVGDKCHDCSLDCGGVSKRIGLKLKPDEPRVCKKCLEPKHPSAYPLKVNGQLKPVCQECHDTKPIRSEKYEYPDGFSALMQYWLQRRWA